MCNYDLTKCALATLGTVGASDPLVFLDDTTLLGTTLQLSFLAQTRDPLSIDMNKESKELGVPTTELTDNGGLLDRLLALGQGLVGDLGSVVLHDANHVPKDGVQLGGKI